jgi:hypothetical protein
MTDARRIKEKYLALNRSTNLVRFGFAPAEIESGTIQEAINEVEFGRSTATKAPRKCIANAGIRMIRQL